MKQLTSLRRQIVSAIAFGAALLGGAAPGLAEVCACAPDSLEDSLADYGESVSVLPLLSAVAEDGSRVYGVEVLDVFKGCLSAGDLIEVADHSGACGAPLGDEATLIHGELSTDEEGAITLEMGLCAFSVPVADLTDADYKLLLAQEPVCQVACDSAADCDTSQYCATDGFCAADGSCQLPVDCLSEGNAYPAPLCFGHPVCRAAGTCGWQCGLPECIDLQGVDFGLCKRVLGYAVVDGACELVSGCDAGDYAYAMFDSLKACQASCE